MRATDEAALICDFAETYHIYDYKELAPAYAATLACGLRPDSRIKMKLAGMTVPPNLLIAAMTADAVRFLAWSKTKDGQKNRNRPGSVVDSLTKTDNPEKDTVAFKSGEAFEAAWRK